VGGRGERREKEPSIEMGIWEIQRFVSVDGRLIYSYLSFYGEFELGTENPTILCHGDRRED